MSLCDGGPAWAKGELDGTTEAKVSWTEPAEARGAGRDQRRAKVSWTGPAEAKVSWTGANSWGRSEVLTSRGRSGGADSRVALGWR